MLMLSHSVVQFIEEFKTHLAPLLASNAANTTISTNEKSAVSHFLVSYFQFPNFPFLPLVMVSAYLLKTRECHILYQ